MTAATQAPVAWRPVTDDLWCPVVVVHAGALLLIGRGAGGDLVVRRGDGTSWGEPVSAGIPVASAGDSVAPVAWDVSACSTADSVHLVAASPDGELLHAAGDGAAWEPFRRVGAPAVRTPRGDVVPLRLTSPPTACAAGSTVEAFATGVHGEILHAALRAGAWSAIEPLAAPAGQGQAALGPGARLAAAGAGRDGVVLVVRGSTGDVLCRQREAGRWSAFVSLGHPRQPYPDYLGLSVPAAVTGDPAVCSPDTDRLDVVVRGPGGDLVHRCWDAGGAWPFVSLGRPAHDRDVPWTGPASVCALAPGRLDVVARAADGVVYHGVRHAG